MGKTAKIWVGLATLVFMLADCAGMPAKPELLAPGDYSYLNRVTSRVKPTHLTKTDIPTAIMSSSRSWKAERSVHHVSKRGIVMSQEFKSFSAPFTASGRSSIVPSPPWHYAGWLMNVAIRCETSNSAVLMPPALGRLTGSGCVHFADWQATTDGSELIDPVYAQYRETIVIVEIERPDGSVYNFCPFIWVDQDISLIRGLLQGWPKKLGTTYLTRSLPIEHVAAVPLKAGSRMGATLAVKERRLIEASLKLTGNAGRPYGFLANKTIGTIGWPDLTQPGKCPELNWVLPDIQGKVASEWHDAEATINVLPHPVEELSLLGELKAEGASVGWAGITVVGALPLPS